MDFFILQIIQSFIGFWMQQILNPQHWYGVPLSLFGLIVSSILILGVAWNVLGIVYKLIFMLLAFFQRLLKFKFPIIGERLESELSASQKRVEQYEGQLESLRTNSAATLFKFRLDDGDVPSEEDADVFARILKTDTLSLLWVTDKIVAELSNEDLQFFRNEYKSGKLQKEFNNWKTYS